MIKFLSWLLKYDEHEKIVRVKSYWPCILNGCVEWPVMLIDSRGRRMTVVPVWDRNRLVALAQRMKLCFLN